MTKRQLETFNRKIDILYDKERGLTIEELSLKYRMRTRMIDVYLKLAKNNWKILQAVRTRFEYNEQKEMEGFS